MKSDMNCGVSKNDSISVLSILLYFNMTFAIHPTVIFNVIYILVNLRCVSFILISIMSP